jgi:hypothetical protein
MAYLQEMTFDGEITTYGRKVFVPHIEKIVCVQLQLIVAQNVSRNLPLEKELLD